GDFDDRGGIRIGWRRANAAALVERGRFRRSVRAHGADGAETSFRKTNRFGETHAVFGGGGIEYALICELQTFLGNAEAFGDGFCEECFGAFGRLQRSIARHDGYAAGVGAKINRAEVGVAGVKANVEGVNAENF